MNAPITNYRTCSLETLCAEFCELYGISGRDLERSDRRSRNCGRRRGPGRPSNESRYPSLLIRPSLPFFLLVAVRRTTLTIDHIATILGLDEWDALLMVSQSERRLATDPLFVAQFERFMASLSDQRSQSSSFDRAMTHEEIAASFDPPLSRQRVVQIEQEALAKLRDSELLEELMEGLRS